MIYQTILSSTVKFLFNQFEFSCIKAYFFLNHKFYYTVKNNFDGKLFLNKMYILLGRNLPLISKQAFRFLN